MTRRNIHERLSWVTSRLATISLYVQVATIASSVVGVALLLGRVSTGFLLDRFFAPRVAMLVFGLAAAGIALLWFGIAGKAAMLAAVLIGFGLGAEADIIAFCISRYFGLRCFGPAFAFAFGTFVLGGAIGNGLLCLLLTSAARSRRIVPSSVVCSQAFSFPD